ncbi:hypothetical protein KQX54_019846 [Cotesia glomerata]|uniref:Uncharacterized protein n=1 Tax=Cotesia glomerata TaxID=32391 RepID=A0AAV7HXH5_COTGL|nr:hypothetical protein KQX54_019846 [Cotesia glomerata]
MESSGLHSGLRVEVRPVTSRAGKGSEIWAKAKGVNERLDRSQLNGNPKPKLTAVFLVTLSHVYVTCVAKRQTSCLPSGFLTEKPLPNLRASESRDQRQPSTSTAYKYHRLPGQIHQLSCCLVLGRVFLTLAYSLGIQANGNHDGHEDLYSESRLDLTCTEPILMLVPEKEHRAN